MEAGSGGEIDALTRAVKDAASALEMLAPHAASLGQTLPESIRAACEKLGSELAKEEIVLAVVGDASMKRALLRMAIGGDAIRGPRAKRERVVRLHAGVAFDYSALKSDGTVLRFARSMPDRDPIYKKSIDDAEAAVRDAEKARGAIAGAVEGSRASVGAVEQAIANADVELEAMGQQFADAWRAHRAAVGRVTAIDRAEPDLPAIFKGAPRWWAFWIWILRWMVRGKWRVELAAHAQNRAEAAAAHERAAELEAAAKGVETVREQGKAHRDAETERLARAHDALAAMEVTLSEECAVSAAEATVESLIVDRARHAGERKDEFFADLADYDASARGDDVTEMDIDLPKSAPTPMPDGLVLVFGAHVPKEADGYVLVRDAMDKTTRDADLRARLPCALALVIREALKNDLASTLARVAKEKQRVVAARFGMAIRKCIADVQRARSVAEEEHQRRLGALEGQRIPKPAEFRKRQVARSASAIEKGAADVLASALVKTHDEIEKLRDAWNDRIKSAKRRRQIDVAIAEINQRGRLQMLELLEGTSEHIAREMQSVGESLERRALDEIHQSYRVQKRVRAESLAPVASEVTGEDLGFAVTPIAPMAGMREAFARVRLRVSIGAAFAAGVAGGTTGMLVGGGTRAAVCAALGIVLGVIAGRLQSPDKLRTDGLGRIALWIDDVDRKTAALLRAKEGDIESGIRTALDDALGETLERLNDAISRLLTIERNAIEGERSTLANLDATRGTLDEHDARLASELAKFDQLTSS